MIDIFTDNDIANIRNDNGPRKLANLERAANRAEARASAVNGTSPGESLKTSLPEFTPYEFAEPID